MTSITETAGKFFAACETGKGWNGCKDYCTSNATFASQSEPLADIKTLEGFANWMQAILGVLHDKTDYVYAMQFEGDKIRHMTKIWHAGWAMKELGWA